MVHIMIFLFNTLLFLNTLIITPVLKLIILCWNIYDANACKAQFNEKICYRYYGGTINLNGE